MDKAEEDNDYDERSETQEEYYLRCIPMAKDGHVLDSRFMIQIARLSHRLGLTDTESWGEFNSEHYGDGKYPKGGPEERPKLNFCSTSILAKHGLMGRWED